jgi:hypothetical protein
MQKLFLRTSKPIQIMQQLTESMLLQGRMNTMANSIEILLEEFFRLNSKGSPKSFKAKINQFNDILLKQQKETAFSLQDLSKDLVNFNENWDTTKHGKTILGTPEITFLWMNKIETFNEERIKKIEQNFTEIQKRLIKLLQTTKEKSGKTL